jgi:hypothetical protein
MLVSSTFAFRPAGRSTINTLQMNSKVDKILTSLEQNKILTKTAQLGLLSKLDRAGFKLSTVTPLLVKADELDLLGVLASSSDKVLGLAVTAVDTAPVLLTIVGTLVKAGPTPLLGGAVVSLGAAATVLGVIPDDSISNVALQTALAVPLGAIVPGACLIGAGLLSKLK